jgi:hypothetical protein
VVLALLGPSGAAGGSTLGVGVGVGVGSTSGVGGGSTSGAPVVLVLVLVALGSSAALVELAAGSAGVPEHASARAASGRSSGWRIMSRRA